MKEAAKGDLSFELRLRKGDELTDLVDEFNLMVRGLKAIISQDREKVGGIMREAEETLMIVNRAEITADEKKQTADHLKGLIVKLKDITGQFKV
jgi:methyl-accepting chemotaxis protein